ncbi:MAG: YgcG family protein [Burkholderiaceae bacterium]|nr:YgcG family protein [Burkholderiaceae bacterium]
MFAPAGASGQDLQPVPPLAARVTDLTGTLAPAQVQALEGALADIEQRKGAQVAILMVPTTRPEAIEQYGIRVAEEWKLGRGRASAQRATGDPNAPAVDDGVLLLVAKEDRRVRIEVGYGLEGAIPDGIARRIIDESITPRFRREDYFGGLQAAVQDLRIRIDGEDLPPPGRRGGEGAADDSLGIVPALVFAFVAGTIASAVVGRILGAGLGGLGAGFLGGAAAGSMLLGLGAGVLVFFLVLLMAPSAGGGLRRAGRHTYRHGPIFFPGGGWGGRGGGGGFGGFGGGGGGFGGGGASGGW